MRFFKVATGAVCLGALLAGGCAGPEPEVDELRQELCSSPWDWDCLMDPDWDGLWAAVDNCPYTYNPDQTNSDGDYFGDACDNCPATYWEGNIDCDADGIGDGCDPVNANWQVTVPPVASICWVDKDTHFGYFTLEFRGLDAIYTDVSSCGNPPQYAYVTRSDEDCTSGSEWDCCMRALPAGTPYRESLCSHVDNNYCLSWPPPPAEPPPPSGCSGGGNPQTYLFCLKNPEPLGNPPPDCNQFEVLVTACSYNEARTLAQNHAVNWTLSDGACPACP